MPRTAVAAPAPDEEPGVAPLVVQILSEAAGRAPFVPVVRYVPTGFAVRLLAILEHVLLTGTWMIVTALPGDGKSTALDRFLSLHPEHWVDLGGGSRRRVVPVLATRVSLGLASADRLMIALAHGLGAVPNLRGYRFRDWLVGAIASAGVRMIVIDDAHELTVAQLSYLRELTDHLSSRGCRVALVLLAASHGSDPREGNPWQLIEGRGLVAEQFRRRLNGPDPVVYVAGLTRREVGAVLKTWEALYREWFPDLELAKWAGSVFTWLTDKRNAGDTGRVRMRYLAEAVNGALALAWAEGRTGLLPDAMDLYHTVVRLTTRGFTFAVLDAELRPGGGAVQ